MWEIHCLKPETCEKGHEKSMDNFPGGICTFLSLGGFVRFSWMTPLPNFSFKQDKLKWSRQLLVPSLYALSRSVCRVSAFRWYYAVMCWRCVIARKLAAYQQVNSGQTLISTDGFTVLKLQRSQTTLCTADRPIMCINPGHNIFGRILANGLKRVTGIMSSLQSFWASERKEALPGRRNEIRFVKSAVLQASSLLQSG